MSRKYNYPVCEKRETSEEYFGITIKDNYRWLENANDPEVLAWVAKENAFTDAYFDSEKVQAKMKELNVCGESLLARRASSVRSWLYWILNLIN